MMDSVRMQKLMKSRNFKYGLPFLVMMLGGSFALKQFTNLRYEYSPKITVRPEELENEGIKMKEPGEVTLETEFEKIKKIDIDNWEMVRGPRPWEEAATVKN